MNRLLSLWRNVARRDRVERDLDEELQATFDLLVDEKTRAGMRPDEARRAARLELGGLESLKDEVRDVRMGATADAFRRDLRYALRVLVRTPGFTAAAVVTLALGIGVNAAVFGVLKSVLLTPLPYADADRLVRVYTGPIDGSRDRDSLSAATIEDITARQQSLERLTAFQAGTSDAVYGSDTPRIVKVAWVEPSFFETLGVSPALGRTFRDDEGTNGLAPLSGGQMAPDTDGVVMLTDAAWQRIFARDPAVVGQDVRINGNRRTVIGVLPGAFIGPAGEADFYLALDLPPVTAHPVVGRTAWWLGLIGRLKPGIAPEAAHDELSAIGTDLAREYASNAGIGMLAMPLRDAMAGDTRTPLLLLMASAALVLVIACANLAGVLLARTLSRRKEFAVRAALGAGRRRLVRQLLTENAVLGLAGGAVGLVLASVLLAVVRTLALPVLPDYAQPSLDGGVMLVTTSVALLTGLAFGLLPALAAARSDPHAVLREETRGASESRRSRRLRGALVAAQMALCVSLLAGAGLLARSLWAMTTAPLGFDPDGVLTVALQLPPREYPTPASRARFLEQFVERLRSLPGVTAAASTTWLPTTPPTRASFVAEGQPPPKDGVPFILWAGASDDYFRALRIPLRRGRFFDARDHADAPPTVIINESLARRFWPGEDALGRRVRLGGNPQAPFMEVVGVVGDVRNDRSRPEAEPMVYVSTRRVPAAFARFLLRTDGDPLRLAGGVERELTAMDRGLPLDQVQTLRAVVGEGLETRRIPVMLIVAFGTLALLLASIGVYALFVSMVVAREGEFAIRLTLGSRPREIAGLVFRQGAGWMAAGLAGGAIGSVQVAQLLRGRLYGVSPFDPLALGLAVGILVGCATVALLIPLRRAARVDPVNALRAM